MTTFRKITNRIHLWLGLTSGLVVFIISITGCIYAFQSEIQEATQAYRNVPEQKKAFLPPSALMNVGAKELPGKHLHAVMYEGPSRPAQIIFFNFEPEYYYYIIYANPYSGEVIKVKNMRTDFFRFILDGHFYLWLPPQVGQPLVATSTLIFVVLLVSGLILWWPRNGKSKSQRFKIKWDGKWRRKNYDLHSVTGFYAMIILLLLALTGLVWGFQWFAKTWYAAAGGKKSLVYADPASDTTAVASADMPAVDKVWIKMKSLYPDADAIEVHPPETKTSSIAANANPDRKTFYKMDYRYFDQYTLEELKVDHIYDQYSSASGADKLMRMNYDIHTGAIIGIPGKIIAFLASLVSASLPVTGLLLWLGRKKKSEKEKKKQIRKKQLTEA
jgi:uncharacterized iron-regulated membrane protein